MKYLVLLLLVASCYASEYVFGDLLGQEYELTAAHIRERRQAQQHQPQISYKPFSQAPGGLKQLVQSLDVRPPVIPIPSPGQLPNLGYGKAGHAQQHQAQVNQYRPQVQPLNFPKQQNLGNVHAAQAQVPNYATAHAGRGGPGGRNLPTFIKASQGDGGQPQIQYSKNVPGSVQQLLNFQNQWAHPQPLPRQHRAVNYN